MASRMVQIGARFRQEDAAFLSRLRMEGALTPSDKLRAIVAEARRRHEGGHDFETALDLAREQTAPLVHRLKSLEYEHNMHSELLARLIEWLPEIQAYVTSAVPAAGDDAPDCLEDFERGAADRVFRLMEHVLQLALTHRPRSYDPSLFDAGMPSVLELARLVDRSRNATKEER